MSEDAHKKILSTFEKHGFRIELGAQFSAKGQIAQLLNAVEELMASPWIPCKDRLPELHTTVIVENGIAQYRGDVDGWWSLTGIEYPGRPIQWDVTRWQPLPPPPDKDEA